MLKAWVAQVCFSPRHSCPRLWVWNHTVSNFLLKDLTSSLQDHPCGVLDWKFHLLAVQQIISLCDKCWSSGHCHLSTNSAATTLIWKDTQSTSMHVCLLQSTSMHVCMCVSKCVHAHIYVYVCMCIWASVCVCVCVCVWVCKYKYRCVCV